MLILTRRPGESILIGDDITVKILSVNGGQIRLGIDAPSKTPIWRDELHRRIQQQHGTYQPGEKQ